MTQREALFEVPAAPPGPVYQGVSAQFRTMFPSGDPAAQTRKAELKGWLRLALAHARALDATPFATVGRAQTSAELRETLKEIANACGTSDAFAELMESINSA